MENGEFSALFEALLFQGPHDEQGLGIWDGSLQSESLTNRTQAVQ